MAEVVDIFVQKVLVVLVVDDSMSVTFNKIIIQIYISYCSFYSNILFYSNITLFLTLLLLLF